MTLSAFESGASRIQPVLFLIILFTSLYLSGCASSEDDSGLINQFTTDKTSYVVGERARLYVSFKEGSGRIEPDIGTVANMNLY